MITKVLEEIAAERARQISKGHTPAHDDMHHQFEISTAAAAIALGGRDQIAIEVPDWADHAIEKWDTRRRLIIASALFVAEIERLDRLNSSDPGASVYNHATQTWEPMIAVDIESTTDPDSEQQDGVTYQITELEGFDPITQTWKPIGSVGEEK